MEERTFQIPVVWQMTKTVAVKAKTLEAACTKAVEDADATGGDYIPHSMESCDDEAYDLNPESGECGDG